MGPAGAGKSAVGSALAALLDVPFVDGDDLHSPGDRARMAEGRPISDEHRAAWVERVRSTLHSHASVVVTCSGLRRAHRDQLGGIEGVRMFFLAVPDSELERRLATRAGHFFPPVLLAAQLAALQPVSPDEPVDVIDGSRPVGVVVDDLAARAGTGA